MTMTVLASAKGAPGVTTTALALALAWPRNRRVLLVEADAAGGDLAAWLTLPLSVSLLTLAATAHRGMDAESLLRHAHQIRGLPNAYVLLAPPTQGPATAALRALTGIGDALASQSELDVLVDIGRAPGLGLQSVDGSGRLVMVCRPEVSAVVHLEGLRDLERMAGLVVVGSGPYRAMEVGEQLGLPVLGEMSVDKRTVASMTSGDRVSPRAPLMRAAAQIAASLAERLGPESSAQEVVIHG